MGEVRHHETAPRQFSPQEHKTMWELHKSGLTVKEIALRMERRSSSISGRLKCTDVHGNFISRREHVPLADMGIDDQLIELHRAGWSQGQIGQQFGFRPTAIGTRLRMLLANDGEPAVEVPDRKKRPCIMQCGRWIVSDSWEIRRCHQCRRNMQRSDVYSEEWSIHV